MFENKLPQLDSEQHDAAASDVMHNELRLLEKRNEKRERFASKLGDKALTRAIRSYNKGGAMEGTVRFSRSKLVDGPPHYELDRRFLRDTVASAIPEKHPQFRVVHMDTEGTGYLIARARFIFEQAPEGTNEARSMAMPPISGTNDTSSHNPQGI